MVQLKRFVAVANEIKPKAFSVLICGFWGEGPTLKRQPGDGETKNARNEYKKQIKFRPQNAILQADLFILVGFRQKFMHLHIILLVERWKGGVNFIHRKPLCHTFAHSLAKADNWPKPFGFHFDPWHCKRLLSVSVLCPFPVQSHKLCTSYFCGVSAHLFCRLVGRLPGASQQ